MINISEIVATWPVLDGWRVSPGVDWFGRTILETVTDQKLLPQLGVSDGNDS